MQLDPAAIKPFVCTFKPIGYLRVFRWQHRTSPLGMGFGKTRFASPTDKFKLLYLGQDLPTCIAEAIIRDRFEGSTRRVLTRNELSRWGVCAVTVAHPLQLLDLRGDGCLHLGVSTDIAGGKSQDDARIFSEELYAKTHLHGILYKSRLRKRQNCVAVYDRAAGAALSTGDVTQMERLADLVPALQALRIELI
ncbi:RES family NAD+ phosphorylase [Acidisoma cellulosilytica]|uniref:RES family NAD+ phosphorylase n=1 Tax=Acidisoma cellulosilyticum TaxID=2802395 RepID=A0A963Z0K3_9PROT|nr:RES family NAD+ phosphorylase [Acidisoma cellulosilyticum]MCB8879638.1 RES family NAD+ phosphorylase [Acidisoma cellulosilyticum]